MWSGALSRDCNDSYIFVGKSIKLPNRHRRETQDDRKGTKKTLQNVCVSLSYLGSLVCFIICHFLETSCWSLTSRPPLQCSEARGCHLLAKSFSSSHLISCLFGTDTFRLQNNLSNAAYRSIFSCS